MEATHLGILPGDRSTTRQDALTWKPLRFLSFYRLILAGLLLALFFLAPGNTILGQLNPELFRTAGILYFAFALASSLAAHREQPGYIVQVTSSVSADILVMVTFMHASGGLDSGLGILLVPTVAAGSLLMPGRMPFFFAALAALSLLGELGYSTLLQSKNPVTDLTRTGLVGIALFTTALLAFLLARRIRESEDLAQRRGVDLANLTELNEYVIQHLEFGILVVDEADRIRLSNDMVWTMLNIPRPRGNSALETISPELTTRLRTWRGTKTRTSEIFTPTRSRSSLLPRFTAVGKAPQAATIIFLEDSAMLEQQAQQMKLAALGRLTASIAHEIRNPLGAISHASQLLDESPNLADNDRRLTRIINDHTKRVNAVIENVLQLSRRRSIHRQDIELVAWLEIFIEELVQSEGLAHEQIVVTHPQDSLQVYFDAGHLHQAFWNLCRNAIHYGSRNGVPAAIEVIAGYNETGRVVLDVQDRGPGIDAHTARKIFEPFFTTSSKGTGLGLYLARELCEYNQAQLNYSPVEGGGSRFSIVFSDPKEQIGAP